MIKRIDTLKNNTVINMTIGIVNTNNTCYMNAVIQLLLASSHFKTALQKLTITNEKLLAMVFHELLGVDKDIVIRNEAIKNYIDKQIPNYREPIQHDAQEFCSSLLGILHDELKTPYTAKSCSTWEKFMEKEQRSIITDCFYGEFLTITKCTDCKHRTKRTEPFNILSVEISGDSMKSCITSFLSVEPMDDYKCDSCFKKNVVKEITIYRNPPVLFVHIKRFSFDKPTLTMKKNNERIIIDDCLVFNDVINEHRIRYEKKAFVIHRGTHNSGHYTAFVLNNNKSIMIDDETFREHTHNDDEYIVMYELVD